LNNGVATPVGKANRELQIQNSSVLDELLRLHRPINHLDHLIVRLAKGSDERKAWVFAA
jgi:hypothetical protein